MGILDNLTSIGNMMPKIDSENPPEKPDKVEKALDESKAQRAELQKNLNHQDPKKVEEVVAPFKQGAFADFAEAGITERADQERYWGVMEEFIKKEIAKDTIEFREIEDFVNTNENLKELKETLQSKDPLAKAKKWIARIKAVPIFGAWILSMAHDTLIKWSKNKEGKDNPGATEMRAFAALLVEKKDVKPKTPEEEKKEKEKELVDTVKKKFSDKVKLDESKIAEEITALAALGIKDEENDKKLTNLIDATLVETSNFMKINNAIIHKQSPENPFVYKLTDIRLQNMLSPEHADTLVAAIKNEDKERKFALKENTMPGIRAIMDAALTMKDGKLEEALKGFEKPATPPVTVASADKK